jgi:hypothetical protein
MFGRYNQLIQDGTNRVKNNSLAMRALKPSNVLFGGLIFVTLATRYAPLTPAGGQTEVQAGITTTASSRTTGTPKPSTRTIRSNLISVSPIPKTQQRPRTVRTIHFELST